MKAKQNHFAEWKIKTITTVSPFYFVSKTASATNLRLLSRVYRNFLVSQISSMGQQQMWLNYRADWTQFQNFKHFPLKAAHLGTGPEELADQRIVWYDHIIKLIACGERKTGKLQRGKWYRGGMERWKPGETFCVGGGWGR